MKILGLFWYYKPANVYGGPVNSVATMLEGLASNGMEVSVFTTNANGKNRLNVPIGQSVNVNGVQVIYFPVTFDQFSINYSIQMAKAISSRIKEFDLVISGLLWHPVLVEIIQSACRKAKVPYIVQLFGQLMPWARNQKNIKKKFFLTLFGKRYLNGAAALQCTDPVEVDSVHQVGLSSPAILIPNSINQSKYSHLPACGLLRQELGIKEDDIVLLFLGRLHRVKRPDIVLEAMINLGRSDVHLIYAGLDEEHLKNQLLRSAQETGYSRQVHFIGNQDKNGVLQAFADSNLLVMPSEQENFGMSAAEALASGLPILTSKFVPVGVKAAQIGAGGVAELSIEDFSEKLKKLLEFPEKLQGMGVLGKHIVQQNYDDVVVGKKIVSEYAAIIAKSRK